jgi:hypothetical protein
MQPVEFVVAILLSLAALTYVLYPLYRRVALEIEQTTPESSRLTERERNARQALQEVEFDFQLGNLEEKDYRSLQTRYTHRALLEMKNRQQREKDLDEDIEEQLRLLRETELAEVEEDA